MQLSIQRKFPYGNRAGTSAAPGEARDLPAPDILVSHAVYKLAKDEKTQDRQQCAEQSKDVIRPCHDSTFLVGIQAPLRGKDELSAGDGVAEEIANDKGRPNCERERQKRGQSMQWSKHYG